MAEYQVSIVFQLMDGKEDGLHPDSRAAIIQERILGVFRETEGVLVPRVETRRIHNVVISEEAIRELQRKGG